jgi:phenylacetate-coenzyme A ligase PaaK-like adenylate-forming protein
MKKTTLDSWIHKKISSIYPHLAPVELEEWQINQFNQSLSCVKQKSAFYRQHFKELPDKISNLRDIQRFPFTSESDIRQSPQSFVCVSQNEIERVVTLTSSGTTGEPKRIFFSKADQSLTIDFFGIGMANLTEPGDRVLILLPGERPGSVGDLLRLGLIQAGRVPVPYGMITDPNAVISMMETQKIDCLVGSPTQILGLAARTDDCDFGPHSVLLSTDYVPSAIVKRINKSWNCEVYNHYGSTEMGLGGGVECEAHRGYHMREADLLFEIVDRHSGNPVQEGEYGEVVFSTLTRQAMPIIRYRTGDMARFLPGACPCGSILKTMEKVQGRYMNFIPLEEGLLRLSDLDEALFTIPDLLNFSVTVNGTRTQPDLTIEAQILNDSDRSEEMHDLLKTIPLTKDLHITAISHYNPQEAGNLQKRIFIDRRQSES